MKAYQISVNQLVNKQPYQERFLNVISHQLFLVTQLKVPWYYYRKQSHAVSDIRRDLNCL